MHSLNLFALSTALHAFVGWRLSPALSLYSPVAIALLWAWVVASSLLVPMDMVKARFSRPRVAHVLTWMGLIAMGLLSSIFVLTVLRELGSGVLWVTGWLGVTQTDWRQIRFDTALAVVPLAGAMTLAVFWNARRTAKVVRVDVPIGH
jgi:predicted PurR-regulated permease PerM